MAEDEQELEKHRESARKIVTDLLPSEYREKIIEEGAKAGTNRPDDPMWSVIGMFIDAWAAAEASRASADASAEAAKGLKESFDKLHQAFNQVPTDASKAVVRAGQTAAGEAEKSITGRTNSEIKRINKEIDRTVTNKLNRGGNDLIENIKKAFSQADEQIDKRRKEQAKNFEGDIQKSINRIGKGQIKRSAANYAGAVLLGVAITTGGGVYVWHSTTPQHQLTFRQKIKKAADHCFYSKKHHAYYCRLTRKDHTK